VRYIGIVFDHEAHMIYTVDGRGPADPGFQMNVGPAIMKHNLLSSRQRRRQVRILGVDYQWQADDFELLSSRFGKGFDRFLLLSDGAVEACLAVKFRIKPLGFIDGSELINRPSTLLTCAYWT
jgi:hypothetical protein